VPSIVLPILTGLFATPSCLSLEGYLVPAMQDEGGFNTGDEYQDAAFTVFAAWPFVIVCILLFMINKIVGSVAMNNWSGMGNPCR